MRAILASVVVSVLVACGGGESNNPPAAECSDGIDNDGDGTVDFPDDLGCTSAAGEHEDAPTSPQCNDGRDNDGDGLGDYPADPGCIAPQQDDETDDCPDGPNCPECGNHKDDDGNGSTDYPNDPGCTSASDVSERVNDPVACGAGLVIKQIPTTNTADGMLDGSSITQLGSPCGGSPGSPAFAYQLFLAKPKVVEITTTDGNTTADTVIDVRKSECAATTSEIACNDDAPGVMNGGSAVTVSLAAGNYYIIVAGHDSSSQGAYTLNIKLSAGEGSACTSTTECGPGLVCRVPFGGTTMSCQQPMCRDGADNDTDGKADYPNDPGCTSPDDNDETDSCPGAGPNCPECGDGVDNDLDTKIDYPMDTTCLAAGDPSESCVTTDGVTLLTMPATTGTTIGAHNDVHPACASTSGHTAGDKTYRIDVPALTTLTFSLTNLTPSFWSVVLDLFGSSCTGTAISCLFDDTMTRTNVAAGTYYLVVDGYSGGSGEEGAYTINVSGKIQNGASCESPLAVSGALTCGNGYACKGTAGSRTCQPATCSDGIDNDGDGKIDYPFDPGCDSAADDTEANPATPPVCSDGMDNDTDTLTDWPADYGCSAASSTSEVFCAAETNPTSLITAQVTTGNTAGATNNFAAQSCQPSASGPDVAYGLSLPVPVQTLIVDLSTSSFDTIVSLRDTSCMTEVGCDDDAGTPQYRSKLTATNVTAGNYAVIVDGFLGASGTFTMKVTGTVAPQTPCSSPLFTGGANAILSCPVGTTCTGTPLKCQ